MKMILATVAATAILATSAVAGVTYTSTYNEHGLLVKQVATQDSGAVEVVYTMTKGNCFSHNEARFATDTHQREVEPGLFETEMGLTDAERTEMRLTDADRARLLAACKASI